MTIDTTLTHDNRLATIRFDRPDQLNAISTAMQLSLIAELDRFEREPKVAAIVLTGNGRAFMAGADLKEYATFDAESFRNFQARGRKLYERVERNQKLVVAAVNGYALGGGFEMVLACDLVVARRTAKMGLPEVNLGLVPGGGGTQRLTSKVGPNRALELLVTGQPRTAEELFSWGLVNRLCDDDVLAATEAFLAPVLEKPLEAVVELKRLSRLSRELPLDTGLDREAAALQALFDSPEGKSRVREFVARHTKEQ
jgi:enoyl-CoA hydratase/carnithine racemase